MTLCFCSLLTSHSLADTRSATSNSDKLEQLRQQIKTLRTELSSDRERKQDLQSLLRNTETRIGKVAALLKGLKRQLRRQNRELKKLNKRRKQLSANLQIQRVNLARQIRAAYAIGQQEYIKILLNQQDPAAVSRTLTYYDYFNGARLERIQSIDAQLTDLQTVEQKIKRKKAKLEQNRLEQSREKNQLEKNRGQRSEVLAKLSQQMQTKGKRLSLMLEDQRRLQRLLNRLADEPTDFTPGLLTEQGERKAFAQLRGKLAWPSRGRLTNRYGGRRKVGKLKWLGVMIKAPEGTDVAAISHGRVAFSDWLRGFGLLTIIDHGDGYMSLYGGNQSLYKEVGDWVEAGEVIASVGNSGGNKNTALYFEIRYKGKPTNPLKWCRNKPKKLARR
ncbi:MAG: peptidoglycan DD-metalloendopeptidase family protein [Gammaproteobacteria bacterium]